MTQQRCSQGHWTVRPEITMSSSSRAAGSTCTLGPAATSRRGGSRPGVMAELDLDQEAALRRLRAAFGFVEILKVVDHRPTKTTTRPSRRARRHRRPTARVSLPATRCGGRRPADDGPYQKGSCELAELRPPLGRQGNLPTPRTSGGEASGEVPLAGRCRRLPILACAP
jgi:hypothetical protein